MEFENYFECIEVCDTIIKTKQDEDIIAQTKITKGKARFHSYKRKLHQFFVKSSIRATKEGRSMLKECFNSMKDSIALLGDGFDLNMLDEEGSKLLDWAMIDCVSLTNQLNLCKRCLLCRQKRTLCRSHIWPKFTIDDSNEQDIIFGLDKYQFKSAGECIYWMLCERCEEILSQNGESAFKANFPSSGEISYSSWLFSFCAGVIFRTLGITIQFPMHYNDSEIYKVLLHCRKHLLSLPVSVSDKVASLGGYNKKELEKLVQQLKDDLNIYLFMSPLKSHQNYAEYEVSYQNRAITLSRDKQLNSRSLHFNGYAHFYLLCCGPLTLIVNFDQSVLSLKNRGFLITSNPSDSDKKYTIPSEEKRVKLLPVGVWPLMEQLTEGTIEDFNEVSRFISTSIKVKVPTSQSTKIAPSFNIPSKAGSQTMYEISFLPKGFDINKPHLKLPRNRCVVLPEGHKVICHSSKTISALNAVITFLLCDNTHKSTSDPEHLYAITLSQDTTNRMLIVDGAVVKIKEGKLILSEYLVKNKIINRSRYNLSLLQRLLNILLPNKHFDNINFLIYLMEYRRYVM